MIADEAKLKATENWLKYLIQVPIEAYTVNKDVIKNKFLSCLRKLIEKQKYIKAMSNIIHTMLYSPIGIPSTNTLFIKTALHKLKRATE